MTSSAPDLSTAALDRRRLLRGGALVAGAAGATVVGAALAAPRAEAATGDDLVVGQSNEAAATTSLTRSPGSTPTLSLTNTGGPSLRLEPVPSEPGDLLSGDIVNTDEGPLIGVDHGDGPEIDILATGADLDALPTPVAVDPVRLLDTRTAGGRKSVVRASSPSALTPAGKLKAGAWVDVAVGSATGDIGLSAIFANAAVVSPEKSGFLSVYAPSDQRPGTSTINYQAGKNLANAAFVGLGVHDGSYVVRIWTSQTTHLLLDLSGAVVTAPSEEVDARSARNQRAQRQAKRAAQLRKSLRGA